MTRQASTRPSILLLTRSAEVERLVRIVASAQTCLVACSAGGLQTLEQVLEQVKCDLVAIDGRQLVGAQGLPRELVACRSRPVLFIGARPSGPGVGRHWACAPPEKEKLRAALALLLAGLGGRGS